MGKKIKEDQLIVIINSNLLPSSFQTSEVSHNKDKLRRSFLWKGTLDANGGHCLVKWNKGLWQTLGILDTSGFLQTDTG